MFSSYLKNFENDKNILKRDKNNQNKCDLIKKYNNENEEDLIKKVGIQDNFIKDDYEQNDLIKYNYDQNKNSTNIINKNFQLTQKEQWLLETFSNNIYKIILDFFKENSTLKDKIQEIRLRANRPIIIKLRDRDIVLQNRVSQAEILQTLERLCENSIYAYKNEICDGFITIKGGHRVGLTGTCVIENGRIINVKYISSLNFRIAREVIDCSNNVINEIIDTKNKNIYNTIIVAPPGKGKTTVLRDLIRKLSNGMKEINFPGKNIRSC